MKTRPTLSNNVEFSASFSSEILPRIPELITGQLFSIRHLGFITIWDFSFRIERKRVPKFDLELVRRIFLRKEDFLGRIQTHVERGKVKRAGIWI